MKLCVFTPAVFTLLRRGFMEFLSQADGGRSEFLISHGIRDAVRRNEARGRSSGYVTPSQRARVPSSRTRVAAALRQLVAAGEYPERLWPWDWTRSIGSCW